MSMEAPETRIAATDRWKREKRTVETDEFRETERNKARAQGMSRRLANDRAWFATIAAFPKALENEGASLAGEEPIDSGMVRGLGDLPAEWPELPDNASIQAELSWVQSQRLRVVSDGAAGEPTVVRLARARVAPPSTATLGWLETSIRHHAKSIDVCARSLQGEQDEVEHVKRERMSIEEIRGILAEMMEAEAT